MLASRRALTTSIWSSSAACMSSVSPSLSKNEMSAPDTIKVFTLATSPFLVASQSCSPSVSMSALRITLCYEDNGSGKCEVKPYCSSPKPTKLKIVFFPIIYSFLELPALSYGIIREISLEFSKFMILSSSMDHGKITVLSLAF